MGKAKKVKASIGEAVADAIVRYPRLHELGVKIYYDPCSYVKWKELRAALRKAKMSERKFSKLFGSQTEYIDGPYPYDVEAVLERMKSGRLTGTQHPLLWD